MPGPKGVTDSRFCRAEGQSGKIVLVVSGRANVGVKKTCQQRETLPIAGFALDGDDWDGLYLLYKAQKQVGATYHRMLASELERQGVRLERQTNTFRVAAIPRDVERAFSKRRQAIEEAARIHGYSTPKGMELATLRTRRPKRDARLGDLIKHWQAEAKALGFELGQNRQHVRTMAASSGRPGPTRSPGWQNAPSPPQSAPAPSAVAPAVTNTERDRAAQLGSRLGQAIRTLDQPAGMSGVRIKVRYRDRERE